MINLPNFQEFINWFESISATKKTYSLITVMAIGLFYLIQFYDSKITTIINKDSHRIDSISIYYTNKLEKCNTENKQEYFKILTLLQESIKEQQILKNEAEKLKLETR